MGKQFFITLRWTIIIFVILAGIKYFTGVEGWLVETLNWVFPSSVGYFLGYGEARRDENRY